MVFRMADWSTASDINPNTCSSTSDSATCLCAKRNTIRECPQLNTLHKNGQNTHPRCAKLSFISAMPSITVCATSGVQTSVTTSSTSTQVGTSFFLCDKVKVNKCKHNR